MLIVHNDNRSQRHFHALKNNQTLQGCFTRVPKHYKLKSSMYKQTKITPFVKTMVKADKLKGKASSNTENSPRSSSLANLFYFLAYISWLCTLFMDSHGKPVNCYKVMEKYRSPRRVHKNLRWAYILTLFQRQCFDLKFFDAKVVYQQYVCCYYDSSENITYAFLCIYYLGSMECEIMRIFRIL